MALIPVQSSVLRAVGYDPLAQRLTIAFVSGGVYDYAHVPEHVFRDLMAAESKGAYFGHNIRDQFAYRKRRRLEI